MANRIEQLKALLVQALDFPHGLILRLSGGDASRRQTAMAAISAAKRDLTADIPELLDIQVRPVPGKPDEIALIKYGNPPE